MGIVDGEHGAADQRRAGQITVAADLGDLVAVALASRRELPRAQSKGPDTVLTLF